MLRAALKPTAPAIPVRAARTLQVAEDLRASQTENCWYNKVLGNLSFPLIGAVFCGFGGVPEGASHLPSTTTRDPFKFKSKPIPTGTTNSLGIGYSWMLQRLRDRQRERAKDPGFPFSAANERGRLFFRRGARNIPQGTTSVVVDRLSHCSPQLPRLI